jgi:ParB-like chromosome segregation protein Spo0J
MSAESLIENLEAAIQDLATLPTDERIEAINRLTDALSAIHPNTDHPINAVKWVPADMVEANDYNPNHVAPPEMRMLHESIKSFGFFSPIVTFYDKDTKKYIVVDGFHRNRVGKEYRDIRESTHGYLPIVVIDKPFEERIKATQLANKARGHHSTEQEAANVATLAQSWSDTQISHNMGMDADTVLRLKQVTGIPSLFKNRPYSHSWILDPERHANDGDDSSEE